MNNKSRLKIVIVLGSSLQIDHLVTHENRSIRGRPLMVRGTFHAPLWRGKDLLQPCVEVEGEKDELRQQVVGGPFVVPKIDGSHPSKDTDE
jgi:hypothetical protein